MTRRIPDLAKPQFSRRYEVHPVKLVSAATLNPTPPKSSPFPFPPPSPHPTRVASTRLDLTVVQLEFYPYPR
ncbi:hypothetical protein RHS04_07353 [Rhizoctonia solani]|uniref:Uncharacterized protein n=1 Tax=Rhizoctonia solani TaxID=456999 RepID=A0A8H7LKF4_9AGAM|nr:hypothetical protein RHS04_07353 [Rhizoctonia solani]